MTDTTPTVEQKMQAQFEKTCLRVRMYDHAKRRAATAKPNEDEDLGNFLRNLRNFDTYYSMSDDHSVWTAGVAREQALKDAIVQLIKPELQQAYVAALRDDDAREALFNAHHPIEYVKYYGGEKIEALNEFVQARGINLVRREHEEFVTLRKRLADEVGRLFNRITYEVPMGACVAADTVDQNAYRRQVQRIKEEDGYLPANLVGVTIPLDDQVWLSAFWSGWKLAIHSWLQSPYHAFHANAGTSYRPLNVVHEKNVFTTLCLFPEDRKRQTLRLMVHVKYA